MAGRTHGLSRPHLDRADPRVVEGGPDRRHALGAAGVRPATIGAETRSRSRAVEVATPSAVTIAAMQKVAAGVGALGGERGRGLAVSEGAAAARLRHRGSAFGEERRGRRVRLDEGELLEKQR